MIRYALVCDQHHEFESWFTNSAAYDELAERGLVTCPLCGSAKVEKALMTPRLARSGSSSRQQEAPEAPREESPQESTREPRQEHEAPTVQAAEAASEAASPAPVAMMTPQEQELRKKLKELRDHLVNNAENVGARFPEEARKMHYGETGRRSIFGVASAKDAEALHEEGIAFSALPVLPDDRN
jgi:hypothetical protein